MLQEHYTIVDNSGKGSPAVVDNFDMGQKKFALGVAGSHKAAGLQIDSVEQAEFGGIVDHLGFENQMESGVQLGAENLAEQH